MTRSPRFEAKRIENGYIVWTWDDNDDGDRETKEFYCPDVDAAILELAKLFDPTIASVVIKRHGKVDAT